LKLGLAFKWKALFVKVKKVATRSNALVDQKAIE
jgi:hypothetical protein